MIIVLLLSCHIVILRPPAFALADSPHILVEMFFNRLLSIVHGTITLDVRQASKVMRDRER